MAPRLNAAFFATLSVPAVFLLLLAVCPSATDAQALQINGLAECNEYRGLASAADNTTTGKPLERTLEKWQSIVLLVCFGAFAIFISLVHRIVRTYVYYDAHLLDTFFDAGGDVNMGMAACWIVAKWAWTATYTWSTNNTKTYGLVGHFWYAAGAVVQLFLFSIVSCEIRIKAPGAKTFLQVIRARHGALPHVTVMVFALVTNIVISGMVMTEGVNILSSLTDGLSKEVMTIVLALVIGCFTVVGGVGGSIYVAYFSCALILSIVLVYFTDIFYDPLNREDNEFGSAGSVFQLVQCANAPESSDNEEFSLLTFLSRGGMIEGILIILSSFSAVFVNQSFWQSSVSSKPRCSVWGFITGGIAWFAIPFCAAFAFGMSYWAMAVKAGHHLVPEAQVLEGMLPVYTSQRILDTSGDFMMFVMTMVIVVTTASAEVLAVSSIIVYDIYQAYIAPFRATPMPPERQMSIRMQNVIKSEEYMEYDRRCVFLKHVIVVSVACLLIPITLVVLAIDVDLPWLFKMLGVVVGSCVVPTALAITWHRVTGAGVVTGCLGGLIAGVVSWLVYADRFDGGLKEFRQNASEPYPLLTGLAAALGVGALACIIVSLTCGGCDPDRAEEEQWELTREIDNPLLPWSVKYAPDIGAEQSARGRPHFFTVRRTFRSAEVSAYLVGVLLAVGMVLVWPALMLLLESFSESQFKAWSLAVLIWACVAIGYLVIVPPLMEFVQTCRQAYYNRLWSREENRSRVGDSANNSTLVKPAPDNYSNKAASDMHSTMGHDSGIDDNTNKERWKTFIHLD